MIILAWIFYFILGSIIISRNFKITNIELRLFQQTFIIISIITIVYHLWVVYELGLSYTMSVPGALMGDEVTFHLSGVARKNNFFEIDSYGFLYTIAWQYIIAINYIFFSESTLVIKFFNVFLFAIISVKFYQIAFLLSNEQKVAKGVYYLVISYLPMVYMVNTLMRETFLTFLIIMILYHFILYLRANAFKHIIYLIIYISLLFLTRFELSFVCIGVILLIFISSKNFSRSRKIWTSLLVVLVMIILIFNPITKEIGVYDTFFGGDEGRIRAINSGAEEATVADSGGYVEFFEMFLSNPFKFFNIILFGAMHFFLSPLPYEWLTMNYSSLTHHLGPVVSFYHIFWYIQLPAIYYGIRLKIKMKGLNSGEKYIIIIIVISVILLSLHAHAIGRYRMPVVPLLLYFSSYGFHNFYFWKNKIPRIMLVYLLLFIVFTFVVKYSALIT